MERDAISDVRKAVPEVLYKDEGDGELYVRNEEGHRDGSCPPKFHKITSSSIFCFYKLQKFL